MPIYCGVDPGVKGAIAAVKDSTIFCIKDMPLYKVKVGKKTRSRIDPVALHKIFLNFLANAKKRNESLHVVLEEVQVMFRDGRVGIHTSGVNYGILIGVIESLGIPITYVNPSVWRPKMVGRKTEKDASIDLVKQLYNNPPLAKKKKESHDRAEAVLLARYGQYELGL